MLFVEKRCLSEISLTPRKIGGSLTWADLYIGISAVLNSPQTQFSLQEIAHPLTIDGDISHQ